MAEIIESPTVTDDKHSDIEAAELKDEKDTYLHGLQLFAVFVGLSLAIFVIILDQTILIPALPVIASDFNSVSQIGWINSSYFITQCATTLLWGQILSVFSQKTPLLLAIVVFEIGSLIAALSRNFVMLIVGRAIAGLGGAAIMVAVISIAAVIIELKRRPIFFGCFGIIFVLGSVLGPLIGGVFTTSATWRWCFWINLPVGGISMATVAFCIPRLQPPTRPAKPAPKALVALRRILGDRPILSSNDGLVSRFFELDWVATLIVLGGIVSLTLALIDGGASGWHTPTVIAGFTCSAVAVILLILWEVFVMKGDGMVPLRVARFRSVWGSAGLAAMRMMSSMAIIAYLPTFMQATRHQNATHSAISVFPFTIGMAAFAMIGAVVVQKTGRYKWLLCAGSAISAIGGGLLYTIGPDTAYAKLAGYQIIGCMGLGVIMMNTSLSAQAEMDINGMAADIPQASALVTFMQLIGGTLGGAIGGSVLVNGLHRYLPSDIPPATAVALTQSVEVIWTLSGSTQVAAIQAYTRALNDVFLVGGIACAVGFFFALLCRDINIKGKKFAK